MNPYKIIRLAGALFFALFLVSCSTRPTNPPPAVAQGAPNPSPVILVPNQFSDQGWSESEEEGLLGRVMSVLPGSGAGGGAFKLPDDGTNFQGTDRAVAKTRAATSPVRIVSLDSLLSEFKPGQPKNDDMMRSPTHQPLMRKDWNFDRVEEEQDNVQVEGWIVATTKEKDNDFHVILAADPSLATQSQPDTWRIMNVEVSGLPPASTTGRSDLVAARTAFKNHFVPPVPDAVSTKYSMPKPVHVRVTGSIFFDVDHVSGIVGPGPLKPSTSWEIHPVTKIEFLTN